MGEHLHLSSLESSFVRVLLVIGAALVLPVIFDKSSRRHRTAIFAIAGLLSLRYLWWRATETIAPRPDMGLHRQLVAFGVRSARGA